MVVALFSQEINESTKNVINSFFSCRHAQQCKFFIEKNIFDGLEKTDNLNLVPFESVSYTHLTLPTTPYV